jgi:putative acetyltransferase
MTSTPQIKLHHFQSEDQQTTRELILSGLKEHWGELNDELNQDLDDIQRYYASSVFIVAKLGRRIVGTGALVPRSETLAEIVRMSVVRDLRRKKVGTMILQRLVDEAKLLGFKKIILETTASWSEVVAFYEGFGFHRTHERLGIYGKDIYFSLDL